MAQKVKVKKKIYDKKKICGIIITDELGNEWKTGLDLQHMNDNEIVSFFKSLEQDDEMVGINETVRCMFQEVKSWFSQQVTIPAMNDCVYRKAMFNKMRKDLEETGCSKEYTFRVEECFEKLLLLCDNGHDEMTNLTYSMLRNFVEKYYVYSLGIIRDPSWDKKKY